MPLNSIRATAPQLLPELATYRAWAEVDLGAIRHNLKVLQHHFGPQTRMMAVVKANAYGLGAIPVARAALEAGAAGLAVSACEEGLTLREAGLPGQILVLGYVPPECAELAVDAGLTLTVNDPDLARALSRAACRLRSRRNSVPVQLKLDTGLHRYGLEPEKALELARLIRALPGLHLQGLYTHFATSDETDPTFMFEQTRRFDQTKALLQAHGFELAQEHLASSASAIGQVTVRRGLVRVGLAMFGYHPSEQSKKLKLALKSCFTLKSVVARLSELPAGEAVGYNRTYIADEPKEIALIPVGYADGYRRSLSNKGEVLINGKRARVLGRVMMDQFVVDVTNHSHLVEGDEVVLVGRQGTNQITLEEIATICDTIPYEILTGLGPRIKRVYTDGGKVIYEHE